ncbi:40S ribosomal protein S21 [Naegleria gruberi]|uniref:40S ribosomal protein S21 n=1 Tax=Naegleria gruberi TaxID=5762 RepID=D2VD54_NAEGR|nr:40S ribosomal protein S21 [Naegleria gruberi]EFC45174.1 40S ribosomal protein S21 [Naegleria gruberi]|eukprot:XP_002677918.1 40S ribosomal protein S21 [Naegleria gruberi strain NEG-M]
MQNDAGVQVDYYHPRKCTATKNLITAKDHASVQITVGLVDENGVYTGENATVALCGDLRMKAKSDGAVNRLMLEQKIMKDIQ